MSRCYLCGQRAQGRCTDCGKSICEEDKRTSLDSNRKRLDLCPPCDDQRYRQTKAHSDVINRSIQ